jgi:hypothetical protein
MRYADTNNDGVLSYSEFLLGIIGNFDGIEEMDGELENELSFKDKDIFDHSAPNNRKELRVVRNLIKSERKKIGEWPSLAAPITSGVAVATDLSQPAKTIAENNEVPPFDKADVSRPRVGKFIRLPKVQMAGSTSVISGPPSWISTER